MTQTCNNVYLINTFCHHLLSREQTQERLHEKQVTCHLTNENRILHLHLKFLSQPYYQPETGHTLKLSLAGVMLTLHSEWVWVRKVRRADTCRYNQARFFCVFICALGAPDSDQIVGLQP